MLRAKNLRGDFALEAGKGYNEHGRFVNVLYQEYCSKPQDPDSANILSGILAKFDAQRAMSFQTSGSIHNACDVFRASCSRNTGTSRVCEAGAKFEGYNRVRVGSAGFVKRVPSLRGTTG